MSRSSPAASPPPAPYVDLDRAAWRALRHSTPLTLSDDDLDRLRGLGEPIDMAEVADVYLPLSRLLNLHVTAASDLRSATATFLGEPAVRSPFVVGIGGSVAVGKSTTARVLRELLARWPDHPAVDLVTTDGFLFTNDELSRQGLLDRKGFPESYDQRALLRFLAEVKAGAASVHVPVYSHLTYDIVPGQSVEVRRPDVLVVEGLNVLQPAPAREDGTPRMAVSDYFDFTVYVDAADEDIEGWYVDRFLALRDTAFADPASFFHRFAALSDESARHTAVSIWRSINHPNLVHNIKPTRDRATLVMEKGADHSVRRVRLRKR